MATSQQHGATTKKRMTLVHNPYNSPLGLYSTEEVAETLQRHTRLLGNGAIGVDFSLLSLPNLAKSDVYKMLSQDEKQLRYLHQQPTSRASLEFSDRKRVAWPPSATTVETIETRKYGYDSGVVDMALVQHRDAYISQKQGDCNATPLQMQGDYKTNSNQKQGDYNTISNQKQGEYNVASHQKQGEYNVASHQKQEDYIKISHQKQQYQNQLDDLLIQQTPKVVPPPPPPRGLRKPILRSYSDAQVKLETRRKTKRKKKLGSGESRGLENWGGTSSERSKSRFGLAARDAQSVSFRLEKRPAKKKQYMTPNRWVLGNSPLERSVQRTSHPSFTHHSNNYRPDPFTSAIESAFVQYSDPIRPSVAAQEKQEPSKEGKPARMSSRRMPEPFASDELVGERMLIAKPSPPPGLLLRPAAVKKSNGIMREAPTIRSESFFKRGTTPVRMLGDMVWPPKGLTSTTDKQQLPTQSPGMARRQQKNYQDFFSQNQLPPNFPTYRAPPGTQHFGLEEGENATPM